MNDEGPVKPPFRISPARTTTEIEAVRLLFGAYASSLAVDLAYQDFVSEVADLPGKYAPPTGELFVAWDALDYHVGCVGLRPLEDAHACEMKRLYVVPQARTFGLGKTLTEAIIEAAKELGYSNLFLDTLPTMGAAASLYQRMGFRRIEAYYGPTPPGTIFMELQLAR
jgi:GNAT superfamily N-acetyltransferase